MKEKGRITHLHKAATTALGIDRLEALFLLTLQKRKYGDQSQNLYTGGKWGLPC